ncbi:MAG: hypothetical protein JRH20_20040 [Deltaproteobacteria bacterium]|nr:hypothetical protein [Deltaproteobacteria bacterium]
MGKTVSRPRQAYLLVLLLIPLCFVACAKDEHSLVGDFFICDDGALCELLGDKGRRYDDTGHWVDLEPITEDLLPPAPYCLDQEDRGIYRVEGDLLIQQEFSSDGSLRDEDRFDIVVRGDIIDFHSRAGWPDVSVKRITRQDAPTCVDSPMLPDMGAGGD